MFVIPNVKGYHYFLTIGFDKGRKVRGQRYCVAVRWEAKKHREQGDRGDDKDDKW